jgi:glutathione S-transferase
MIRIYNFPRGARGLRAGWVCEEMGLPYEAVPVTFPPDAAYLALNALGTVPFLEDNGVGITESVAIMLYLAETYGPTPLLPKAPGDFAKVLQWTVFGEASLGASLNPLLAARFGAPAELRSNWSTAMLQSRVAQFLRHVAAQLGDREFLVGRDLTLADICLSTAIQIWQSALSGTVPETLVAYRSRLAARPACLRALKAQG